MRGDISTLCFRMYVSTLRFSALLYPIMVKHEWLPLPPVFGQHEQQ
jgi:hypothetical protein